MIALALDTSGPRGTVAVLRHDPAGDAVLAREPVGGAMRHGVDLFPAMERALGGAGVSPRDVALVAVGTGPGSFTGLRVGVTAARAFAYAAGARLVGVPSVDAWAASIAPCEGTLAVVLDAHVKAVYLAIYQGSGGAWTRTEGPALLPPEDAAVRIPAGARIVGDGVLPYATAFAPRAADPAPDHADAVEVARLALLRDDRGEREPAERIVPLYLTRETR